MEQIKTLYTFTILPSKQGVPFEFMGEVLGETSIFAESEEAARKIAIREYGVDLRYRLELKGTREVSLFGATPDKNSMAIEESLLNF